MTQGIPSSDAQGKLVEEKRNRAEIVATKDSGKSERAPGKQASPDHFQTALRILAPDCAEKSPLYCSVQSRSSNFRVAFVCSYTAFGLSAII